MLRDYQQAAVSAAIDWHKYKDAPAIVVMPTGCHAAGTGILMYDGSTKCAEDIAVGDLIMGDDGSPRHVLRLCRGAEKMYRIKPIKGDAFVVNASHKLALKISNTGKPHSEYADGHVYDYPTVSEYIKKSNNYKHLHKLYRSGLIEFDNNSYSRFPIDPWMLGALLGDGSFVNGTASLCTPDREIIDRLKMWATKNRFVLSFYEKKKSIAYNINIVDANANRGTKNRLRVILESLGLWGLSSGNKFIPNEYKTASSSVRRDVLAGLLDTDGHLSNAGYDYISKSEALADDVCFIARSLGLAAYKKKCKKSCQGGHTGTYWRVSISGDTNTIPCCVERKKAPPRKQKKNPLVTGFSVEALEVDLFYGFEVSGNHLYLDETFTVHHNSGKSHVIKELAEHYAGLNKRVLIMAHRKELLMQTAEKIIGEIGYYSASLGDKDISKPITVASVQSIARMEHDNHFDVLLIDECHLVSNKREGQYWDVIHGNPSAKLAGFTATPYRSASGPLSWGEVVYDIKYDVLLAQNYLTPVQNKMIERAAPDWARLDVKLGDFIIGQIEDAMCEPELVQAAIKYLHDYAYYRNSVLIFCVSVRHCELVMEAMRANGITNVDMITGETRNRDEIIDRFKREELKYLINCEVLTTGFDAPCVDTILCLRPTKSKVLWEQMLGRGTRLYDGKEQCLLLDMAGNLREHGTIGSPYKGKAKKGEPDKVSGRVCPECEEYVEPITAKECSACGHIFPEPEKRSIEHEYEPDTQTYTGAIETMIVDDVGYYKHVSRASGKTSLRVDYYCAGADYGRISEWLSPHNESEWARNKAQQFFEQRGCPLPKPIGNIPLEELLAAGEWLNKPYQIVVDYSEKFPRIINYIWEKPEALDDEIIY